MGGRLQQDVDQIVIFDTRLADRELRYERTRRALACLGVEGELPIVRSSDRLECLGMLSVTDVPGVTGEPRTLLLCDMVDDEDREHVGNVGARLLRSVARHADLSRSVWRVLWTLQDHPTIITDIEPYAHAFVWFDYDDIDGGDLAAAIEYVLSGPPQSDDGVARTEFRPFAKRALTADEHQAAWMVEIERLLKPNKRTKINDTLAVAGILRGVPDKVTNRLLRAARDGLPADTRGQVCTSVDELLGRLRGDKDYARHALKTALGHMDQQGISTQLSPLMVENAKQLMQQFQLERDLRYWTYLTQGEDILARTIASLYTRRLEELGSLHGSNTTTRHEALDYALDHDMLSEVYAHPDVADCTHTQERRVESQCYVIGTYNDTIRSRERGYTLG